MTPEEIAAAEKAAADLAVKAAAEKAEADRLAAEKAAAVDKKYSQADLDAITEKVRATERKKALDEQKEAAEKAAMTESERLKAELADRDKKVTEAQTTANRRVVQAEARVVAISAGVKPELMHYVLKLADISSVTVNDDGEPDAVALKAAVDKVLIDMPQLKGASGNGGAGMSGDVDDGRVLSDSEMIKLQQTNPEEYKRRYSAWLKAKKSK
jgi:hypothetical protein